MQINYRGLIHTNGDTFTIVLGQYETYLGQSRGDLTGAFIVADKPVRMPALQKCLAQSKIFNYSNQLKQLA